MHIIDSMWNALYALNWANESDTRTEHLQNKERPLSFPWDLEFYTQLNRKSSASRGEKPCQTWSGTYGVGARSASALEAAASMLPVAVCDGERRAARATLSAAYAARACSAAATASSASRVRFLRSSRCSLRQ
eukprot:6198899-Pleurochrysis_carterae.AAC.1